MSYIETPVGELLPEAWVLAAAGRIASARRVKPTGGKRPGAGRPKLPRCPCGRFTVRSAVARGHLCKRLAPTNPVESATR
jgi:hypothetical protein